MKTFLSMIGNFIYYIWFIFIEALRIIFCLLDEIKWWLFSIVGGFMFLMWLLYLFMTSGQSATPYDGSSWLGVGIGFFVILMICIATSHFNRFFNWLENGFVTGLVRIAKSIFSLLSKPFKAKDIKIENDVTLDEIE